MFPVSVVIPTLGGSQLHDAIHHLNKGKLKPSEILICIPEAEAWRVVSLVDLNVKIVKTSCRGQVAQRAVGLSLAAYDFVLQMDDDILLDEEVLRQLVDKLILLGPGNVVAPALCALDGTYLFRWSSGSIIKFFENVYSCIVCNARWGMGRMGTMTSIGIAYSVDPSCYPNQAIKIVDWLPGGCVLSCKKDLVLNNFYPFSGKAYCEDLFHTLLRKSKNIKHYLMLNIFARTAVLEQPLDFSSFRADLKARYYIRRYLGGSIGRFFFWAFLEGIKKIYANLKNYYFI